MRTPVISLILILVFCASATSAQVDSFTYVGKKKSLLQIGPQFQSPFDIGFTYQRSRPQHFWHLTFTFGQFSNERQPFWVNDGLPYHVDDSTMTFREVREQPTRLNLRVGKGYALKDGKAGFLGLDFIIGHYTLEQSSIEYHVYYERDSLTNEVNLVQTTGEYTDDPRFASRVLGSGSSFVPSSVRRNQYLRLGLSPTWSYRRSLIDPLTLVLSIRPEYAYHHRYRISGTDLFGDFENTAGHFHEFRFVWGIGLIFSPAFIRS